MMSVISIRIPRELKEKMEKFRDEVNWSEEIRRFIENRIRELERKRILKEVEEMLSRLPTQPYGAISSIVREDRDSH